VLWVAKKSCRQKTDQNQGLGLALSHLWLQLEMLATPQIIQKIIWQIKQQQQQHRLVRQWTIERSDAAHASWLAR